jgi:hypothetical protein
MPKNYFLPLFWLPSHIPDQTGWVKWDDMKHDIFGLARARPGTKPTPSHVWALTQTYWASQPSKGWPAPTASPTDHAPDAPPPNLNLSLALCLRPPVVLLHLILHHAITPSSVVPATRLRSRLPGPSSMPFSTCSSPPPRPLHCRKTTFYHCLVTLTSHIICRP